MVLCLTLSTPWAACVKDVTILLAPDRLRVCKTCVEDITDLDTGVTSQYTVASVGEFEFEVPIQGVDIHLRSYLLSPLTDESNRASFRLKSRRLTVKLKVEASSHVTDTKGNAPLDVQLCLGGRERQIQIRALPFGQDRGIVGAKLWPCALLVGGCLRQMYARKGKHGEIGRVVELGAGTGICGIIASAYGAEEVLLTDSDRRILSFLRANVDGFQRRRGAACLRVERLDFSSILAVDEFAKTWGSFDVVVCSDVIYEHKLVAPLCQAARKLLRPNSGQLVLGIELRPCGVDLAVALPEVATQYGFALVDFTEALKSWVIPAPVELNVPPLDTRHRLFVGSIKEDTCCDDNT